MRSSVVRQASIAFEKFGKPNQVLKLVQSAVPDMPGKGEITVSIKSNFVSPEDIRTISGISLTNTKIGVAGTTGVGVISAIGPVVDDFSVNDMVLVNSQHTWCDATTVSACDVIKVPGSMGITAEEAAALPMMMSAYAVLNNYGNLKSGDAVALDEKVSLEEL